MAAASRALHRGQGKGQLARLSLGGERLGALANGKKLPPWAPVAFDLGGAKRFLMRSILKQGGFHEFFGALPSQRLVISDIDHTLVQSDTWVGFVDGHSGEPIKDPMTDARIMVHNAQANAYVQTLRERFAHLTDISVDWTPMGEVHELDMCDGIANTIEAMRNHQRLTNAPVLAVTARSHVELLPGIKDYFARRQVRMGAVFGVNNAGLSAKLEICRHGVGARKALIMAAMVDLYRDHAGSLSEVFFYDDHADNLRRAMELLPKLFPNITFTFVDVVHQGDGHFEPTVAAVAHRGQMVDAHGKQLSRADVANYDGGGQPVWA